MRPRRGADPDLVIRLPDGTHAAIAMSLTDYAGPADTDLMPSLLPLLDVEGLRQAADFIAHLRQTDRFPVGGATSPRARSNSLTPG